MPPQTNNPGLTVLGDELLTHEYVDVEAADVTDGKATADQFNIPSEDQLGRFHNAKTSKVIQHEKPWHRYVLHLAARAKMSAKEISAILGVSVSSVQILFRQTWFQRQYNDLVSKRADAFYENMLEGQDVNSLLTLVEIRDDKNQKGATRVACATDILDRMKGKAIQRSMNLSGTLQEVADIDRMKEEYAKLCEEEQKLLGASAKQPNVNGVTK